MSIYRQSSPDAAPEMIEAPAPRTITADYVLPTGEWINPRQPWDAFYYDIGQTAMVLRRIDKRRTRPTRVLTSHGIGEAIGTRLRCYHDQTAQWLGEYEVVGLHHFSTGTKLGEVPDRLIHHCVCK